MQTKTLMLGTLNTPCACRCRYCLLSWEGTCPGAEYPQAEAVAERIYGWLGEHRPEIGLQFYYGFSMDSPYLLRHIAFARRTGAPAGRFLQMDGLKVRTESQAEDFFGALKQAGIELVDFTFYGTEAYHDRFAGRTGDFAYMLRLARTAHRQGIQVEMGVSATRENLDQLEELTALLEAEKPEKLFLFLPHELGKGVCLQGARLTAEEVAAMPQRVRGYLNMNRLKIPVAWKAVSGDIHPQRRVLNLMVTRDNVQTLLKKPVEEILSELEARDDAYHGAMPDFAALCALYAEEADRRLFRQDDLQRLYETRYGAEHGLHLPDIHNQRENFSLRY